MCKGPGREFGEKEECKAVRVAIDKKGREVRQGKRGGDGYGH